MSLPPSYTDLNDAKKYFRDALEFLKKYEWLYNYPNTDILVNNIFDNFPGEWKEFSKHLKNEDLNNLPLGKVRENAPHSLKIFFDELNELKPETLYPVKGNIELEDVKTPCIGLKKKHEIISLVPFINDICKKTCVDTVIDIGSGRGYLSQVLNSLYKYRVLGIEGNADKVCLAKEFQQKYYKCSQNKVVYVEHFITEESSEYIEKLYLEKQSEKGTDNGFCIAGLHACADLSVTILDVFTKIDQAKALVIMPCCYHRIEKSNVEGANEYFKYFPASQCLESLKEEFDLSSFLRTPFLRLACQERAASFMKMTPEEHQEHARSCIYRAILQLVAVKENCTVQRLKRKTRLSPASGDPDADFESYLSDLSSRHTLIDNEVTPEVSNRQAIDEGVFLERMWEVWRHHKDEGHMVEMLSGLQAGLQSLCENMVLLDRVQFLEERGIHCELVKVTDDVLSPRCHALLATKH